MSESKLKPGLLKNPVHLLALGLGSGYAPRMPGTIGTIVGVLLFLGLQSLPLTFYIIVTLVSFVAGIWFCASTAKALGVHDHPAIVWDEIVGFLITMIAVPMEWIWVLLGFGLFRLFDIWKPWPIRVVDMQVKGGFGIMLDDLIAAVYAWVCLQIFIYLLYS